MAVQARQRPEFETPVHRRIYEYVEQNGRVTPGEGASALEMDRRRFEAELSELVRRGYLDERQGAYSLALGSGPATEFTSDDVDFTIRPARQDDIAGIVGAIRSITREKTYLVAESVAEQLDYEGVLIRHNDFETRMFFVATVGETIAGWVHIEAPRLEKLSHAAKITVGTRSQYRSHGIGGRLLERGLEWAAEQGYRKVYNSIPATNQTAARFLEAHGFETEAIRKDHYKIDDEFVAELMMAKQL